MMQIIWIRIRIHNTTFKFQENQTETFCIVCIYTQRTIFNKIANEANFQKKKGEFLSHFYWFRIIIKIQNKQATQI